MSHGIYVAMSGASAQAEALDVVAHNVSNAGTHAMRQRATFKEVLSKGTTSHVTLDRISVDARPGALEATGRKLDLAVSGQGLLAVNTPDGVRYTRGGSFSLTPDGQIADASGNTLRIAGGGQIDLAEGVDELEIARDGRVFVGESEIGRIECVTIPADALVPEGSGRYRSSTEPRPADPETEIWSGHVEKANTDVIADMVELVKVSRTYEALNRMLENYKQIDERTAREIGSP